MAIHFRCECGREFHVQAKRAGRQFDCPSCDRPLEVPYASTLPSPRGTQQSLDTVPPKRKPTVRRQPATPPPPKRQSADSSDDIGAGINTGDLVEAGLVDAKDPGVRLARREARLMTETEPDEDNPMRQSWEDPYLEAKARRTGKAARYEDALEPRKRLSKGQAMLVRLTIILVIGAVAISAALLRRPLMEQRHVRATQLNEEALLLYENDNTLGWEDTARAIELERKAVSLSPKFFEAHFNMGNMLNLRNQHQEAARAYDNAVELRPDHVDANVGLGISLFRIGRAVEAKNALTIALNLDPGHADGHLYMSYTLYQTKEYAAAWEHLQTARDLGAHFHAAFAEKLQRARMGHPDVERAWSTAQ